ncbi:hypothetical protein TPR58_08490 [Sphingomonas sp. HF-S3]|uniref:Uncharacterized protein n=1 Tax=Sphingomonas rustica TaxID=3103142 RepID=A0ABV0B6H7_9SPHN
MMRTLDDALFRFRQFQAELNVESAEDAEDGDAAGAARLSEPDLLCPRVSVADVGGGLTVDYRGSDYIGWDAFLGVLAEPGIARHIVQLRIGGPDQGANGLKTWDFAALIDAAPDFSRLAELQIEISDPGDHNQSCVEDDQLPGLIALMPGVRTLTLPQAPERAFFDLDLPRLRAIRTGGDWRTRGFIGHIAGATRLPELGFIDFTDSHAPWMSTKPAEDPEWDSTPYEDFEQLFRSPVMERARGIRLRNSRLTEAQYRALQAIRPRCQFSVLLSAPHVYVSHWGSTEFPFRHLLPFG